MFKISKGLGNLAAATLGFYRQIGVEEVQVPARGNTNINLRPLVPPTQKKAAGPMPPAWDEDELQRIWILRKLLNDMEDVAATEFLVDKLKDFKTNDEFFLSMKRK